MTPEDMKQFAGTKVIYRSSQRSPLFTGTFLGPDGNGNPVIITDSSPPLRIYPSNAGIAVPYSPELEAFLKTMPEEHQYALLWNIRGFFKFFLG